MCKFANKFIQFSGASWEALAKIKDYKIKFHYKTILKKHLKWAKMGIYDEVNKILVKKYILNNLNKNHFIDLLIDSTNINNKNGIESIGLGENKKKKQTKISIISINNEIISTKIIKGNTYDGNSIEQSIIELRKMIKFRRVNLIGDKGYHKNKKFREYLLKKYKTNIIYPQKKNQRVRTNNFKKKKLKNRYKVEHCIQQLKKFNRISLRQDKTDISYNGFIKLAHCLLILKI